MATWRKLSGLIAALILATMGGLMFVEHPFLSATLVCAGLGVAAWQGWYLWTNRAPDNDPYDLNSLWERPEVPDEPDPEAEPHARRGSASPLVGTASLCRFCGEAVSGELRVCPFCKNLL
jgi:uncharacterized iron-regulated membrane protein